MTQPVIRIQNLVKSFGDTEVLRDINLEVNRGEVVVVLGPSGSGKSTMLRCINRLETPTSGHIWFEDIDVCDKHTNLNEVRSRLGMVFQSFNLFPNMTAKKNVMLAQRKVLKRSAEEAEKVAEARLAEVGMADRMDYKPAELSGSLISLMPLVTALKFTKLDLVRFAIIWARVVFPTPGGPQKIMEETLSSSSIRRRSIPSPSRCFCPI